MAAGAEILECDVRHTKDGVLVVCHDETIDATTTGQGRIADMTYDEILQYNLKDRAGKPTDEKMPTLEEYLTAVLRTGVCGHRQMYRTRYLRESGGRGVPDGYDGSRILLQWRGRGYP